MNLKSHLIRHAGPAALLGLAIASVALRGGSPPDVPCDGKWVKKTVTETVTSCDGDETEVDVEKWVCIRGVTLPSSISFEPNAGQAPSAFEFVSRSSGFSVGLDDGGAELGLLDPDGTPARLRLHLDGSADHSVPEGLEPLPGVANYLIGRDSSRWLTNIASYAKVRYRDVYPGIDAIYYGAEGELEHDFVVHPGADPSRIRMRFTGADSIQPDSDGSLAVSVNGLRVTWRRPVLYQMLAGRKVPVDGRYRIGGGHSITFEVANYDRSADLVIDPVIAYVSYFGRSGTDAGGRVAVDAAGNAYTAGVTYDAFFPVTPGAPFVSKGNHGDVLITKFNPSGSQVLYSTHIGGANSDGATAIAVDPAGNIYLTGTTDSDDYPVTPRAPKGFLQPPGAPNDPGDCVVTKLNSTGNAIVYSTYFGGTRNETCYGIAVDSGGNAYVTGATRSNSIPVSDDAPQRSPRGDSDGFLFKLNPEGTGFVYSTLFGGARDDNGLAVALDAQGAAYVAGFTRSNFGFPITPGALQSTWGGTRSLSGTGDAFVLKLNPAGSQFEYSTYLGGDRDEAAIGITVDSQGNAYVAGNTVSTNFRTTDGAYQREHKGLGGNNLFPGGDAFAVKLNPTGTGFVYSTLLGGTRDDWGTSIAVDPAGNAYIGGSTLSADFPTSQDAHQRRYGGTIAGTNFPTGDAFLAQLNPAGTALVYSTYIGGSGDEIGFGVAVDRVGGVYLAGSTMSPNLPVTQGAAQTAYGGTSRQVVPFGDVFTARFGTPVADPNTPAIRTFGSAANGAAASVAPGEWIILNGSNLGPAQRADFTPGADGSVPNALAGTRVLFDGVAAPVLYASAASVQVAVPFAVAGKPGTQVIVEVNGRRSAVLTIPVSPAKPTLFTTNGQGNGQGAIIHLGDDSANGPENPAFPGSWVSLAFTGGGQTSPPGVDGQRVSAEGAALETPAAVTVGGREVEVSYAGGAYGQIAGLYRADVKLPDDLEPGDHEVILSIGPAGSQQGVTITVRARPPAEESAGRTKVRSGRRSWLPTRRPVVLSTEFDRGGAAAR